MSKAELAPDKAVRPKRVAEPEYAKALAVIFMIFVHAYELCSIKPLSGTAEYAAAYTVEFLGSLPAAGIFMFCMGWGFFFSKSTPRAGFRRAFIILILALIVNFFEQYIPCLLYPGAFGSVEEYLPSIIATDIYSFCFLAMITFACIRLIRSAKSRLAAVILLLTAATVLNCLFPAYTFTSGSEWGDTAKGLFFCCNEWSYFPFIVWIAFPCIGYIYAFIYSRSDKRWKFDVFLAVTALVFIVCGKCALTVTGRPDGVLVLKPGNYYEYYSMNSLSVLTGAGMISLELLLIGLVCRLRKGTVARWARFLSTNILPLYVTQWIVLGLLSGPLQQISSVWLFLPAALLITLVSVGIVMLYNRIREKIRQKKTA